MNNKLALWFGIEPFVWWLRFDKGEAIKGHTKAVLSVGCFFIGLQWKNKEEKNE